MVLLTIMAILKEVLDLIVLYVIVIIEGHKVKELSLLLFQKMEW